MTNDTEYMYASARIRAAEGKDTASARLQRMLDCHTTEGLLRTVIECGFIRDDHTMPETLEEAWDMALSDAAALVREAVPDPSLYDFLFAQYDCNNIKTALKAGILGQAYGSGYDENFYHCGTFSPDGLTDRLAAGDRTGLPIHMGAAVDEAMAAYDRTGEGRQIDFILDKACYADMAEGAKKTGVALMQDYVAAKADFTNVLSSARLSMNKNSDTARAIFDMVFVPGGSLAKELFTSQSDGCLSYAGLLEQLPDGLVKDAVRTVVERADLRPEKIFEDAALSILNRERYNPFGIHVPAVFFWQREMELKNGRIIGAGLVSGVSGQQLRERVRVAYA